VPKVLTTFKISEALKAEFERCIKKNPNFDTATDFYESAIAAFIVQTRRKEQIVFPLEFVSDKSSDKVSSGD
jgi:hypothetical protein